MIHPQKTGSFKSRKIRDNGLDQRVALHREKSKFTEQQIAFALKQAEQGTSVQEIARKLGITDATFYKWRQKYGGMGTSELRRMRLLGEENAKLKQLVEDLSLDKILFQDALSKKEVTSRGV